MFIGCFTYRFALTSLDYCSSQSTLKAWISIIIVCARSVIAGTSLSGIRHNFFSQSGELRERSTTYSYNTLIPYGYYRSTTIAGTVGEISISNLWHSAIAGSR